MPNYKVTIETTNKKLLQAVCLGEIPEVEACEFKEKMLEKKKRHGTAIKVFVGLFLVALVIILLARIFWLVAMPSLILYFTSASLIFAPAFAVWQFNGFYVARKYLRALQEGYPNI